MFDPTSFLDRAGRIAAVVRGVAGFAHERVVLRARAQSREHPRNKPFGTLGQHRADHLGDHVARLAYDHRVAGPHVLGLDLIFVVQRRDPDCGAPDKDGFEHREGRCLALATDRHLDVAQQRRALLGRELVRDRPLRRVGCRAQRALAFDRIDLDDDAIDLVGEVVPMQLPIFDVRTRRREVVDDAQLGVHRQAERGQVGQHLTVR